jgi:hypothetical protein
LPSWRRQHGHQGQGHGQGGDHSEGNGQDQLAEHQRGDAGDQQKRCHCGQVGQGAGGDRRDHLIGALVGGLLGILAQLVLVPGDVLQHHDGVVQQQPHAQRQAAQTDHVQGQAAHAHAARR